MDKYWVYVMMIAAPAFAMAIATIGPAIAQGIASAKALEGIARQPEAAGDISRTLLFALVFSETLAVFTLLVCLVILFVDPVVKLVQ